jgi:hypothetical protein
MTQPAPKGARPPMKNDEHTPEGAHSFSHLVAVLANGKLERELSERLHDLAIKLKQVANASGKSKGALAIKFNFKTESDGTTQITYDVKLTEPVRDRPTAIAWMTPGGNMTIENPRQTEMGFLRDASGSTPRVRDPGEGNEGGGTTH